MIPGPAGRVVGGDARHRVLSPLRLKVLLISVVALPVLGLSVLTFALVTGIFARLTPSIRADLAWKARRGAVELARTVDLGLAIDDAGVVRVAFREHAGDPDVLALAALNARGAAVATHGESPVPLASLFAQPEATVVNGQGFMAVWASAAIEGNVVGRVVVVVSTARLDEGERLRRDLLRIGALGCLLALGLSLLFVQFYLVPLITITQQGLRVAREMEIAQRLQVSMLPRTVQIPGVELAAAMVPASEVGGDYYDVIPAADGAWIGIGDVAGHGVQAGVIMLMVQSTMNAIVGARPDAAPREVLGLLNRVLYGNIRERLQTDEHVTLSLLRFRRDGRVVFAGAHEDMVVCRGGDAPCDVIATPGPWMGAVRDVTGSLADGVVTLGAGDLLVLFSDGITEARSPAGDRFGIERLCAEIERRRAEAPDRIRAAVFSAVTSFTGPAPQEDDMTLLVLRYLGSGAAAGGSKSRP